MQHQLASNKADIFNVILMLYAGEDHDQVFRELKVMADRYPREVEFYVPQLCTYLFHFTTDGERENFIMVEGPGTITEEETKTETPSQNGERGHRRLLKDFLLERSQKST